MCLEGGESADPGLCGINIANDEVGSGNVALVCGVQIVMVCCSDAQIW